MFGFVYILRCVRDGEILYYTGRTLDPNRRYMQHKRGKAKYTKRFNGNIVLEYLEAIPIRNKKEYYDVVWKREKRVKTFSHEKKAQMIKHFQRRTNENIRKHMNTFQGHL